MVLGHEGCGVLRHSQQSLDELDSEPEELSAWFKMVRRGICLETSAVASISDTRARDREAVIRNVRHQVNSKDRATCPHSNPKPSLPRLLFPPLPARLGPRLHLS
jgi:carbonic anhydrase